MQMPISFKQIWDVFVHHFFQGLFHTTVSFFWILVLLQILNLQKKRKENICTINCKYNMYADLTMCFSAAPTDFSFNKDALNEKYQLP